MNKIAPVEAAVEETIFTAIPKAAGEVKVLGKSDKNKFDNYDFVSIDKFLALVNPICAKYGLFPFPNQKEMETYINTSSAGKQSTWARFTFEITLSHSSGTQLMGQQIVCVPLNGAQASGSAQSYALKQFFRAVFMIPTGDKDDADLIATEQHHEVVHKKPNWAQTVTQDLPESATSLDKATALCTAICAQWKRMKGEQQLMNEWDRRSAIISAFEPPFPELHKKVCAEYDSRMNVIKEEKEAA